MGSISNVHGAWSDTRSNLKIGLNKQCQVGPPSYRCNGKDYIVTFEDLHHNVAQ